jgi:type I restriction enzyme M protein
VDEEWPVFMAEAKWCGHDSRGKPRFRPGSRGRLELLDDVPRITERFHELFGESERFWTL